MKTVLKHYSNDEKCFYLSCENIEDNRELAEILASTRDRRIILLDEISFVKNWDRAIKHEVDRGQHHIIMITGSHSYDLKKGSDLMPGRFGAGGFPDAVAEGGIEGKIPQKALDTYWRWPVGDIVKLGKQKDYLEEIMIQVATTRKGTMTFLLHVTHLAVRS